MKIKYKIIRDVNISGKINGDFVMAEPHAMEVYIERGQVEEVPGEPIITTNTFSKTGLEKDSETFMCTTCSREFKTYRGLKTHKRSCKKK